MLRGTPISSLLVCILILACAGAQVPSKIDSSLSADPGAVVDQGIAALLDDEDRLALAASTLAAIATGNAQAWDNSGTGVQAKVVVKQTVSGRPEAKLKILMGKMQAIPRLGLVGEDYLTSSSVRVRRGPGTDYVVTDHLSSGQRVSVLGRVDAKDWYVISKDGVFSGFVPSRFLTPAPSDNLPDVGADSELAMAVPEEITEITIPARPMCRVVSQEIVTRERLQETAQVEACMGPEGWAIR